jgi:hypothetical protein
LRKDNGFEIKNAEADTSALRDRSLLGRMDGFSRAGVCTRSTFGAKRGIDGILVSFGDSFHRALTDTSAASDTFFTDYVSHNVSLLIEYIGTIRRAKGRDNSINA